MEPPPPDTFRTIPWREEVLSRPVLRNALDSEMPYRDQAFRNALADVSLRDGYVLPKISYDIRRGVANLLNECGYYSTSQRNQVLGHTTRPYGQTVFERHYQSDITAVNMQSVRKNFQDDIKKLIRNIRRLPLDTDKVAAKKKIVKAPGVPLSSSWDRYGDLMYSTTRLKMLDKLLPGRAHVRRQIIESKQSYSLKDSAFLLGELSRMARISYKDLIEAPLNDK
jgi:hypothetical protein